MFRITKVNDITVIFSPMAGFSTSGLGIFVRAGARYEKKQVKGIAHFTEHMLFKGSKRFSYKAIKQEIEGRGGSLNGYTAQESAAYYAQFLNKNIDITLDILSDMVTFPCFEEREIEKERNVVLEELKMYNDLPHYRAFALLDQHLWEGHPLGEDIIGREETVTSIGKSDFERFKREFYLPSLMCVCCVGDIDEQRLLDSLKKKFPSRPSSPSGLRSPAPLPLRGRKIVSEHKPLDQTHFCLGFRGLSYKDELHFEEELLHIILGANMSSRLFEEVREKRGLCYDISTETKKFADSGAFIIHCGLDKKNVASALSRIIRELKKIKDHPVGAKELERAKDYFLGQLSMGLERPGGRMFYCAESYLARKKIHTFPWMEQRIRKIDRKALSSLAAKIFDFDNMCLSCVGNIEAGTDQALAGTVNKEAG